jgi:peptidylprolyl isomerase
MPPMPRVLLTIAACLALLLTGCGSDSSSTSSSGGEGSTTAGKSEKAPAKKKKKTKPEVAVPKGPPPEELVIKDLEKGTGRAARSGYEATLQYVGVNYKTGKQFDASWDRGEPFTFRLGEGLVIAGWERGIEGMKIGGRRELIIPPELGYGSEGSGSIPPNETLIFIVDLLAVK